MRLRLGIFLTLFSAFGCGDDDGAALPELVQGGELAVRVQIPADSGPGLRLAANDLALALGRAAGLTTPADVVLGEANGLAVRVSLATLEGTSADLADQAYEIAVEEPSLRVTAESEQGAAYGLYRIATELGVVYHHPEETFFPEGSADARLPTIFDGSLDEPRFRRRGFHEHTQHPIVASEFFLKAGGDAEESERNRGLASNYLRWLFRNRQNVASWHMLRTVDLDSWVPYIQSVNAEADELFIETGVVIGFVDEQQNAYRTFRTAAEDARPFDVQIPERIDDVLAGNFDFLTFQIGASEFTKPADADLAAYLQIMVDHISGNYPEVTYGTWIHITCGLEADDGSNFFHLPSQADESIRSWVHTTMFYTLEHPAPVYECENFHHQRDYYDIVKPQNRDLEFFPETGWWLGFDNNVPLELPIYGWSRAWDIQQELDERTTGHVNFTTGREWGYWRYDHYLNEVTWDATLTWEAYLDRIATVFQGGSTITDAIKAVTDLQVRHFYEEHPELYFYIAGELPQDEVGEVVDIIARRPKRAYTEILGLSDEEFAAWQTDELEVLRSMRAEYAAVIDGLADAQEPAEGASDSAILAARLHQEAVDGMRLLVLRFDQAISLYEGVEALRPWWVSSRTAEPDEGLIEPARTAAEAALAAAKEATAAARTIINGGAARYRYPAEMLTALNPDSLTIYKFGYIEQTQTGFFWTRRDDQLETLTSVVLDSSSDAWAEPEPTYVFVAPSDDMTITVPDSVLVASVLGGFLPTLIFGLEGDEVEGPVQLRIAQDTNANERPDEGTEQTLEGTLEGLTHTSVPADYPLDLLGPGGDILASFTLVDLQVVTNFERVGGSRLRALDGSLAGGLRTAEIVGALGELTGTDAASAENFIRDAYMLPMDEEVPETLPFALDFVPRDSSF
ncbi:MAG: hypothetical protein AAF411_01785 [Myxococcota bacterium]